MSLSSAGVTGAQAAEAGVAAKQGLEDAMAPIVGRKKPEDPKPLLEGVAGGASAATKVAASVEKVKPQTADLPSCDRTCPCSGPTGNFSMLVRSITNTPEGCLLLVSTMPVRGSLCVLDGVHLSG